MNKKVLGLVLAGVILVTGCSSSIEEEPVSSNNDVVEVSELEKEEFPADPELPTEVIIGESTLDECRRLWGPRTNYIEETREHCFKDSLGNTVGVQVDVLDNVMEMTFEVDVNDHHINREGKVYSDRVGMALATFERHIDAEYHGEAQGEYTDVGTRFTYPNGNTVDIIDTGDLYSELAIKRVIIRRVG